MTDTIASLEKKMKRYDPDARSGGDNGRSGSSLNDKEFEGYPNDREKNDKETNMRVANDNNPGDLFAELYAESFTNLLEHVADELEIKVSGIATDVSVVAEPWAGEVQLQADVTVTLRGINPAQAALLIDTARKNCDFTKTISINGKVSFHSHLVDHVH